MQALEAATIRHPAGPVNVGEPGGVSGSYGTVDAALETAADMNWAGNNLTQFQVGGFMYRFDGPPPSPTKAT